MQSLDSWNAYIDPSVELRINHFGFYGGLFYNINNVREITSGEGANESTVNILTNSTIQHRLSFTCGTNYTLISSKKHQVLMNGGVISKSISLNGNGGRSLPFLLKSGFEFRLPVFKNQQSGIYYNYLYGITDESKSGHQLGFRLMFGKNNNQRLKEYLLD